MQSSSVLKINNTHPLICPSKRHAKDEEEEEEEEEEIVTYTITILQT